MVRRFRKFLLRSQLAISGSALLLFKFASGRPDPFSHWWRTLRSSVLCAGTFDVLRNAADYFPAALNLATARLSFRALPLFGCHVLFAPHSRGPVMCSMSSLSHGTCDSSGPTFCELSSGQATCPFVRHPFPLSHMLQNYNENKNSNPHGSINQRIQTGKQTS